MLALGVVGEVCAADGPSGDHYVCYKAKAARAARGEVAFPVFVPRNGDVVVDGLGSVGVGDQHARDLKKAVAVCAPANKNGEGLTDDVTHLEGYKTSRTRLVPRQSRA